MSFTVRGAVKIVLQGTVVDQLCAERRDFGEVFLAQKTYLLARVGSKNNCLAMRTTKFPRRLCAICLVIAGEMKAAHTYRIVNDNFMVCQRAKPQLELALDNSSEYNPNSRLLTEKFRGVAVAESVFDQIIRKELPAEIVHEDDDVLAFEDNNAQAPVHVLVIPKEKRRSFADFQQGDPASIGRYIQGVARVAQKLAGGDGYRIVFNVGQHGQQSVDYLHAHILGGKQLGWPPG